MNKRVEDYLKTIYVLTVEKNTVLAKLQDVSNMLSVTIQTANEMIKKMVNTDLVRYIPYKGVRLSVKGKEEAIKVIRAHRILEVFLTKTLKFSWSEVHEDAEKLEHATSERLINALYEFLGKPTTDPHGHPIPKIGTDYTLTSLTLLDLEKDDRFIISRINESDKLFEFLDTNNIKINDKFKVLKNDLLNEEVVIKNNQTYKISYDIASKIFIDKT